MISIKPCTNVSKQDFNALFSPEALEFFKALHQKFNPIRKELLAARTARFERLKKGERFDFLPETEQVRKNLDWKVAPAPTDLNDRRVEITGPVDQKMMINALNSGAKVFMADFEDSNSPTWSNIVSGQINCGAAIRRTLSFTSAEGKEYRLAKDLATLVVRPRGWHLNENHVTLNGEVVSASLFDFAFYFFHNAKELIERKSGPYFYLPKMESHLEARLWNQVFIVAQELLGIKQGTIRATVLIETLPAAFEMEEILFELKEHAAGLNAGRWDYIFSLIKKYHFDDSFNMPDRHQITMNTSFMRAYTELLIKTCHKRGAHAMGGMAAFIPSRKDAAVNETALAKVREDKLRESKDGFDGTWVAHPDLVPVATKIFDDVLGTKPNQKDRLREEVNTTAKMLQDFHVDGGAVTEEGVRANISIALQYLDAWLRGSGAVAIFNLMEDAATAEISRAELWQWLHHSVKLKDGRVFTADLYNQIKKEELKKLSDSPSLTQAEHLFDQLVLDKHFLDFLTLPAYQKLLELTDTKEVGTL